MSCFKHLFNKSKVFQYKTILHSNYFYLRLFQNNFHLNNVNKICSRSMHKSDDVISSSLLKECLQLQNKMTNYSIIDNKLKKFCNHYKCLEAEERYKLLTDMSTKYSTDYNAIINVAKTITNENFNETKFITMKEKLQNSFMSKYLWLFIHIGRLEHGVKFLVDMRTDVLEFIKQKTIEHDDTIHLQQLNTELKNLLLLWFSVGFLKLERITWSSSCDMLEKIANYEAVHPVRSWTDLKHRVGPDRRCFAYTHSSMPNEPLIVLHTALRPEIVDSVAGLTATQIKNKVDIEVDCKSFKAANFYSISASQKGLQGIELGNYIIKRVAKELIKEFPKLNQFSTLSPIPKFKNWLFDKFKQAETNPKLLQHIFTEDRIILLQETLKTDNIYKELREQMNNNSWLHISNLADILEPLLKQMCIWYLYVEKKRGYALCNVANFHLRNGAEMWRINWMADMSVRGLSSSCGMMVNYRYYLEETNKNSQNYIQDKIIPISGLIQELMESHQHKI